jgi:putative membrane protein
VVLDALDRRRKGPALLRPFDLTGGANSPVITCVAVFRMRERPLCRKDYAMWWNHDLGWAGWLAMTIGMFGFWIVVALLILVSVRAGRSFGSAEQEPRQILERRLARGEIDVEEYRERLEAMSRPQR